MSVDIAAVLDTCFAPPVFSREGRRRWTATFHEVTWIVDLDRRPRRVYGLMAGLWPHFAGDRAPATANSCPLIVYAETAGLPGAPEAWLLSQAFDLRNALEDVQREELVKAVGRAVENFISRNPRMASVRRTYASGELEAAFVHKDLRSHLEGGPPQPISW